MNDRNQTAAIRDSSTNRRTRPLHVEHLEARLMNAIDAIEFGLEAFNTSRLQDSWAREVAGEFGVGSVRTSGLVNQAPVIVRPISFSSGSVVTGNTVRASVAASDNAGELGLSYRWSVITSPQGSNPSFSTNNTNAARNVTLTFDRAGSYDIMVTAIDAGGLTASTTSRITVNPTLTSVQVISADGRVVNPSMVFNTATVDPAFRGQGIDQFGQVMAQSPPTIWTMRTGPANGRMTQTVQGDFTRLQFSHFDQFGVQATIGDRIVRFTVMNSRSSARIDLLDTSGRVLQDGTQNVIASNRAIVNMRVFDQQGNTVNAPTNVAWSVRSAPSGGAAQVTQSGTQATIIFSRTGSYDLSVQANGQSKTVRFQVNPILSSLTLTPGNVSVQTGQGRQFTVQSLDQFGLAMPSAPQISWSATGGSVSSSGLFTAGQTAGAASVSVASGELRSTVQVTVTAPPAVTTSLRLRDASGNTLSDTNPVTVTGSQLRVDPRVTNSIDGVVNSAPTVTMATVSAPTSGSATFSQSGSSGTIQFTRAGSYDLNFTSGSMTRRLRVTVTATLTALQITPGSVSIQTGQSRQFSVAGVDQFGQAIASLPSVAWTATGGSVSSSGLFTAGSVAGSGSVRANAGAVSATATVTLTPPPSGPFQNAALSQLVQTYYADQMLNRTEVMAILRSVGSDSVVDAVELNDLRTLVNSTQYVMPSHVRGLALNTVTDNPANLRFQGQAAGNLTAGASSTLLNRLVDKWFLGVDVPGVTLASLSYGAATGTLFNVGPSLTDVKQGMVGDCYFLAALGSIASKNQQAIRDIFDDNGDGTFTVRFFGRNGSGAPTADYVTVDRRLPTYSGGFLYYAGYGLSATSATTVLWVALAEKAYAQWNETGRAGRTAANTYAGIEGGWMSNVNFQVLGYNSTNYSFATTAQQTLISAISSGLAVTAGTKTSVASGLVSSHAYSITGFNSATGRFTLHNPWGNTHPAPLTWGELQANFSMFTTTDPRGSGAEVVSSGFRSERMEMSVPSAEQFGLTHRIDIGTVVIQDAETLQSLDGLMLTEIAGAWFENPSTTDPLDSLGLPSDPSENASDDLTDLGGWSSRMAMKDLALMDLYSIAVLR